jgi:hypothetical protein
MSAAPESASEATQTPRAQAASRAAKERVGAILMALVGVIMTTSGVFGHYPMLVAPGSALALFGGAWLGNALARQDVRLFPAPHPTRGQP